MPLFRIESFRTAPILGKRGEYPLVDCHDLEVLPVSAGIVRRGRHEAIAKFDT